MNPYIYRQCISFHKEPIENARDGSTGLRNVLICIDGGEAELKRTKAENVQGKDKGERTKMKNQKTLKESIDKNKIKTLSASPTFNLSLSPSSPPFSFFFFFHSFFLSQIDYVIMCYMRDVIYAL